MAIRRFDINLNAPKINIKLNRTDEVYVDTTFLLHCFIDHHRLDPLINKAPYQFAKQFLNQLAQRKTPIVISSLAFAEAWHVYLKLLYQKDHGRDSWTPRTLKDHPDIITHYKADLEKFHKTILQYPHIRTIGIPEEAMEAAFRAMLNCDLGPFDSFHFSTCCSEKTEWFITGDRDFKRIPCDNNDIDLALIIY